jgi:hypothetical protein
MHRGRDSGYSLFRWAQEHGQNPLAPTEKPRLGASWLVRQGNSYNGPGLSQGWGGCPVAPAFSDDPCIVAKAPREKSNSLIGSERLATGCAGSSGLRSLNPRMRFRSPSKQRVWIIQHNILPWRQFSRAIGKLATQKRNYQHARMMSCFKLDGAHPKA